MSVPAHQFCAPIDSSLSARHLFSLLSPDSSLMSGVDTSKAPVDTPKTTFSGTCGTMLSRFDLYKTAYATQRRVTMLLCFCNPKPVSRQMLRRLEC